MQTVPFWSNVYNCILVLDALMCKYHLNVAAGNGEANFNSNCLYLIIVAVVVVYFLMFCWLADTFLAV